MDDLRRFVRARLVQRSPIERAQSSNGATSPLRTRRSVRVAAHRFRQRRAQAVHRLAGRAPALRMDFDFKGGGGFVVARRAFSRAMPEEYAVHFRLRGRGAVNNLELKLIDATGQNVWRHVEKDLQAAGAMEANEGGEPGHRVCLGSGERQPISQLGSMEFAIVAGEGGKGTLWIADLEIEDCDPRAAPERRARRAHCRNSRRRRHLAGTGWKPRPDDPRPWIVIDWMQARTFGGLIIDWLERCAGKRLSRARLDRAGGAGRRCTQRGGRAASAATSICPGSRPDFCVWKSTSRRRAPRCGCSRSNSRARSMPSGTTSPAAEARGWHPRWLHREQSVWTPIGTSHGMHCALMNEDGMVEVDQGSFSIEPMLWIGDRLFTWADVASRQELLDDWMPVPSVDLGDRGVAAAHRSRGDGERCLSRALPIREPHRSCHRPCDLFVLMRPFQVTPPWQSFRNLGGVSPIHDLAWRDGAVRVNETTARSYRRREPAGFGAMRFDEGFIASRLLAGTAARRYAGARSVRVRQRARSTSISRFGAASTAKRVLNCMPLAAMRIGSEPAFDWRPRLAGAPMGGQWLDRRSHPRGAHGDGAYSRDPLRSRFAARTSPLHALLDPGRRDDERGLAAHGARARKFASSFAGMRPISAPTASCLAASTAKGSIGWWSTTVTDSCWR